MKRSTAEPLFLVVDLFCGAGGVTTGFAMAQNNIAKVIACVNHDPKAIESHWKNHPEVKHFEEDIRTLDLTELTNVVKFQQSLYPNAKLILWASLECTNFSKAKGGQPRDADSRTLANHLHRYVSAIHPNYVMIENVVEFRSWGPLDENGKPVNKKNGEDFEKWRADMKAHGFLDEWTELNSADFGAYTSRNRLFGVFYQPDLPMRWPAPTHQKVKKAPLNLKPWMPVKDVLDFSDEGQSIFTRKKPLSDKTLERIYAGLLKYVAKGDTAFISKYFSGKPSGKNIPVSGPAGTIKTADGQALVQPVCLLKYNSTDKKGKHTPPSINCPAPVITAQSRLGVIQGEFLQHYYGNGFTTSTDEPCPTITTKERVAIIQPEKLSSQNQSIDQPAGTIMTADKHRLVTADAFIVNPSHGGHSTSADAPCPVIVARQDKAPLYLVQTEKGNLAIEVYADDTPAMIKIKEFMAAYSLIDIKMRMLRVHELLKIQGFPTSYVLCGNQSDQKKFIGNSVVPLVVKVWIEAIADEQISLNKTMTA